MMENLFLKLVSMSISASWVALAVVVLRFVFRSAPKGFRCVLWALVAVRLLCPFSIQSSLSIMPREMTVESPAVSSTVQVSTGGNGIAEATDDSFNYNYTYDTPVQSVEAEPAEDPVTGASDSTDISVPESSGTDISLTQVLPIVWLCGVAALLGYSIVSYLRLKKKVSVSVKLRDNIYLCDYVPSPFILGVFRPKIYLPSDLSEGQLEYVLAHENAHLKRSDNLIKPVGFVLLMVYWFNPVIWLAYILLCRDIELACDERVIRDMGAEDKRAYSEALLSCSVPRKMILSCPVAFGEVGVKERVKSVLNYKKPAFWVLVIAVAACVVAAVCLLTDPVEDEELIDGSDVVRAQAIYFSYNNVKYDLKEQEELINGVTAEYVVGDYMILECSISPEYDYYAVFDTVTEGFVNGFEGRNLAWLGDDINTAVYSFLNELYGYSGELIGSLELPEDTFISSIAYGTGDKLLVKVQQADNEDYSMYVYYKAGDGYVSYGADAAINALENSIVWQDGYFYFTLPDFVPAEDWSRLQINGVLEGEDSIKNYPVFDDMELESGKTYMVPVEESDFSELYLEAMVMGVRGMYEDLLALRFYEYMDHVDNALTGDEIAWFNEWCASTVTTENGAIRATPISAFLTSLYEDIRDMDFEKFLQYAPFSDGDVDEAEFAAICETPKGNKWFGGVSLEDMPVPVNKFTSDTINSVLAEYTDITLSDLNTDDDVIGETIYVPEYDAYYNFTSDFAAGTFYCTCGVRDGDIVTLYCPSGRGVIALVLRETEEGYHILAHPYIADWKNNL